MDNAPKEQEQLYQALFDCNLHIPEDRRFTVPFICVSAVPCGLLYKENLESIPTVSDTFTALFNCKQTNEIAITLIKFALEVAGCPSEKIEQVQNAGIQETGTNQGIHTLQNDEVRQGLQFHKLLVDIVNALPGDLRRQLINMGSGHLSSNPIHTESLHVHFLCLIQQNVIGRNDVSMLHQFIEAIRRQDILDRIDEYCREVGHSILPRTPVQHPQGQMIQEQLTVELHPAPEQESRREPVGLSALKQVHPSQLHHVEMDKPTESGWEKLVEKDELAEPELKNRNEPNRHGNATDDPDFRNGNESTESEQEEGDKLTENELEQLQEDDNRRSKGCNACRDHIIKWRCCITVAFVLSLMALLCCLILFLVFEFYPQSTNGQAFLEEGDVVMVSNNGFDPFYYTAVNFTRNDSNTQTNGISNIKLYMQQCSKLVPNQRPILTNVTSIPSTNEDHRHPVYQGYLVRGSKVVFTVNITTHAALTNCSAALYLFRDYQLYYKFLYFDSHWSSASKICLFISNTSQDQHVFTPDTSSYYFAALSAPTGSDGVNDISFQTSGTQMYYTTDNLSPSCSIVTGTNSSCSVPLNTLNQSVQLSIGMQDCFLAVLLTEGASTGSNDKLYAYLSYYSSTARNPVHNIAQLLMLVSTSLLLALTIVVCILCCVYYCIVGPNHTSRSGDPMYEPVNTTET